MHTVHCRRTLYPEGKAVTMDLTIKPINLRESDFSEPKTRVIVFAVPVTFQVCLLRYPRPPQAHFTFASGFASSVSVFLVLRSLNFRREGSAR